MTSHSNPQKDSTILLKILLTQFFLLWVNYRSYFLRISVEVFSATQRWVQIDLVSRSSYVMSANKDNLVATENWNQSMSNGVIFIV